MFNMLVDRMTELAHHKKLLRDVTEEIVKALEIESLRDVKSFLDHIEKQLTEIIILLKTIATKKVLE